MKLKKSLWRPPTPGKMKKKHCKRTAWTYRQTLKAINIVWAVRAVGGNSPAGGSCVAPRSVPGRTLLLCSSTQRAGPTAGGGTTTPARPCASRALYNRNSVGEVCGEVPELSFPACSALQEGRSSGGRRRDSNAQRAMRGRRLRESRTGGRSGHLNVCLWVKWLRRSERFA